MNRILQVRIGVVVENACPVTLAVLLCRHVLNCKCKCEVTIKLHKINEIAKLLPAADTFTELPPCVASYLVASL